MPPESPTNAPSAKRPFALFALGLATLWLLVGACFKLFLGTPADLPQVIQELPLDLGLTYKLAIGTELVFVALAIGAPRIGWILIAAIYVLFELILWQLVSAGADSCGCFGSKVTIAPSSMMAYDGILLALLLISRPWKGIGPGSNKLLVTVLCAVGFALPFLLSREVTTLPVIEEGEPEDPTAFNRPFMILDIEEWVGELVYDTPLAELLEQDIFELPTEGLWVLWRWDCGHCAAHLEELANNPPAEPFITLVRLKQSTDVDENRAVHVLPTGPTVVEASLPARLDYAIQTPAELRLEGATILSAEEDAGH